MTAADLPDRCPTCAGPRLLDHPAGMVMRHRITCPLLAAEDARKVADVDELAGGWWSIQRPATATERTLLGAGADDPLLVILHAITPGVVRRDFEETAPSISTPREDQP